MIRRQTVLDTYRNVGATTATVYLPTPSATEDAGQRLDIVRKNAMSRLEDMGAAPALSERVENALVDLDHGAGQGRVLVVTEDELVLDAVLERPVARESVHLGPCPALLPLLAATQVDVRHLAVLVDRTGADLMLRHGVSDPLDSFEVEGSSVRVHRSHPGGWSQKRFQQTAENAWEDNAREIVDAVVGEHPDVDLIVCGGDVRAVGFFTEHLPEHYELHVVEGSRHADEDAFLDEADVALRARSADATVELIVRWRQAEADDLGSTGTEALADLAAGRVEHLLVVDDTTDADRRTASFSFDDPILHAPTEGPTTEAPITDVAVAMAVATGADVTVVPATADLGDGIAALRRF